MAASLGPQCFAAFAATMGNLVMGTSISWTSPALPLLQKPEAEGGFSLTTSVFCCFCRHHGKLGDGHCHQLDKS